MANLGRRPHPSQITLIAEHCKQTQQQCAQLATGRAAPGSAPHTPRAPRAAASRGRRTSETPMGGPKPPIKRAQKFPNFIRSSATPNSKAAVSRDQCESNRTRTPPFDFSRRALQVASGALWRLFWPKLRPGSTNAGNAGPKIKKFNRRADDARTRAEIIIKN